MADRTNKGDRDSHEAGMSEAEFERVEDNLDAMTRPSGVDQTAWRQQRSRNRRTGLILIVTLAIGAAIVIASGGSAAQRPSCAPHTSDCRETSNGVWVPLWYYGALSYAQYGVGTGRVPSTTGALPSASQLEQAGATSEEAGDAESYDSSSSASGSDDSGGGGSDDSGDDSGDGGDGGGDGGD